MLMKWLLLEFFICQMGTIRTFHSLKSDETEVTGGAQDCVLQALR